MKGNRVKAIGLKSERGRIGVGGLCMAVCMAAVVVTADDYNIPVRPIGVNGQIEWNAAATQFMYAPTFAFKEVPGAAKYAFALTDEKGADHRFEADAPNAALSPVWAAVADGMCELKVVGIGKDGRELGLSGERKFRKVASFRAERYPGAAMGYAEAAKRILAYVFRRPYLEYLLQHGKPDASYPLNSYPSKMLSLQIIGMIRYAQLCPQDRERAIRIARLNADHLIARAQPADAPLAFFPPTYDGRGEKGSGYVGEKYRGMHMLHYPAAVARSFFALSRETGDAKYRNFAIRIADTYVRLQGEDGTWWLKVEEKEGKPVADNRLIPTRIIPMLEETAEITGDAKYRAAAERAFAYMEKGPMTNWAWDGQFEDIVPVPPYRNLSKYGPCDTAIYLLKRFPGDRRRLAQAREMLRFSEDQFVLWEAPHQPTWKTPVALEQYHCYRPIDESVAKLISTYLALYRAEGRPEDLAKAKALGDSCTRVMLADGRLRTFWNTDSTTNEHEDWVNGQVADALALEDLAAAVAETPVIVK